MPTDKIQDYREPSFIDVNGVRTAYRRQGSGEAVLFLHGAGLTRRWFPFYEALSKGADLIAPEHPGFGDSELPDTMTDFTDLALHYADLLKALGLEKVHVVGHSFGGWIGAAFASIYPEKVKRLTLISPMGLRPPTHVRMPDLFRMSPQDGLRALLGDDGERWLPYMDEGDAAEQAIRDYQEMSAWARFTWNPRYDLKLETRLKRIDAPTQVILPQNDGAVPIEIGMRYAELIRGAKVVTVTGAERPTEHLLSLQEPQRLAAQVLAAI